MNSARFPRLSRRSYAVVALLMLAASIGIAYAQVGGGYDLSWNTVDGGGGTFSIGGIYSIGGTIGQPDAGVMAGGIYTATGGFWGVAAPELVGHITWQGRPAQPSALQQLPITLTVKSGATEANYPIRTTSASGFFTVPLTGLANGSYTWRVKSAQVGATLPDYNPGFLAVSGTLTLTGASITNQEMGVQRSGDSNNDNIVNASDFIVLKNTFGKSIGQPGYDNRADFSGDTVVNSSDFILLKNNFGFSGAPPIGPARP